jgi:hypothetical protein
VGSSWGNLQKRRKHQGTSGEGDDLIATGECDGQLARAYPCLHPSNTTVFTIQVYVDDGLKYQASGTSVDTSLSMSPGQHYIVAQAWDNGGGTWKSGEFVNVK